jgi:hypothetical protein
MAERLRQIATSGASVASVSAIQNTTSGPCGKSQSRPSPVSTAAKSFSENNSRPVTNSMPTPIWISRLRLSCHRRLRF